MYFNILLSNFEWSDLGCHDHGLIIKVSPTKDPLCFTGRRLPWILKLNTRYTSVGITNNLPFIITMFYSIHQINWFTNQTNMYLKISEFYNVLFPDQIIYSLTEVYNFYIRVHPMKQILFYILGTGSCIGVSFHDGPGLLSKRLHPSVDHYILTSAFLGLLQIRRSQSDICTLTMQSYNRRKKITNCRESDHPLKFPLQLFSN